MNQPLVCSIKSKCVFFFYLLLSVVMILKWKSAKTEGQSEVHEIQRVFYISDLHDGIRNDLTSLLLHLGQKVILGGPKGGSGGSQMTLVRQTT